MTSSVGRSKRIIGCALSGAFPHIFLFFMFLNIQIYLIILMSDDEQFTLTTKKSLHITFKFFLLFLWLLRWTNLATRHLWRTRNALSLVFASSEKTGTTLCLKNVPPLTCYNLDIHDLIAIIFGRGITEKVRNQIVLSFPTLPI